jgi:hypothetical protein
MRSEPETPLRERYLWMEGILSAKARGAIRQGLSDPVPPNSEIVFVGFSYADLPLGKEFEIIFPRNRPDLGLSCRSRIVAATQQWGKPFHEIPHGFKTIAVIQFPDEIPQLVRELPTVSSWYESNDWVCLCNRDTWECLKKE